MPVGVALALREIQMKSAFRGNLFATKGAPPKIALDDACMVPETCISPPRVIHIGQVGDGLAEALGAQHAVIPIIRPLVVPFLIHFGVLLMAVR